MSDRPAKKITLIEPKPPGYHVFSKFKLPRLGLPILGAMLKSKGHEVRIYCEDLAAIDYDDAFRSDLVMISTLTATAPRAYKIADLFRFRGIPVIMGGPHPTYMPDEALGHAEFVVRGEGERTTEEFIDRWEAGASMRDVPGLSYVDGGQIRHNPAPRMIEDLDALPFPDLTLIEGHGNMCLMPVQTSRGCPFDCTFCSVTKMWGRRYRFRSTESVMEELSKLDNRELFFYDDNFTANPARAKELLRRMRAEGIRAKWMAQTRTDVVRDKELLKLMQATNCSTLYIGLESINPKTLMAYNKKQTVGDVRESVEILHRYEIKVHGMFVLGSDEDDVRVIRDTLEFAKQAKIDTVQFMILTPLPGTQTYFDLEAQGRIFSKDWSLYDGHHVVHEPARMTPFELQTETFKAMKRFYSLRKSLIYLITFRFLKLIYRFYGRSLITKWEAANKEFLKTLEAVWKRARPRIRKEGGTAKGDGG